ncbi:MAG: PIG-L family deacetylase [Clostridia bacterium]|nr:PIG-L family deacetylase [Clostridia bacterium]
MKKKWGALIFGAVLVLAAFAAAAPARDITSECTMLPGSKKKEFKKAMDGNYRTYWNSYAGEGAAIQVTVPEGEEASGVWLQWYEHEHAVAVQVKDEQGEWAEYGRSEGIFLSDYLPLPEGTKEFRIANPAGEKKSPPMPLAEIHVYGQGELPPEVQVWQKPAEKADLMLVAGHPDDEILWFGGILPRYAGVEKKAVQVCIMVPTLPRRRLEELDGLWTCGVKNYPVFGHFRDFFSLSLKDQYKRWDKTVVYRTVTGWIRRFQPEVVITHDIKGEYGHGAHRACADAVIQGLELAADEKKFPDSYAEYGTWDVPKCYLHLYPENVIDFDWRVPLPEFGGRTAFQVAEAAFACHISQQDTEYKVEDFGPGDCSLFGLYRSLVGPDERHDDLFENLGPVVD